MDNQLPNPAPPPYQPPPQKNEFDFITNSGGPSPKKTILPTGGSKQSRIFIVVFGLIVLTIIAIIVFAIFSGISNGQKEQWLNLAQKQAELIRITDIATTKATERETKNLASTTKATLLSSQKTVNNLSSKNGATVNTKTLALGKDTKTDKALTTAEQSNNFDKVFLEILKIQLLEYQTLIKKLHDGTNSKSAKATLDGIYRNAGLLVKQSEQ